MIHLTLFTGIQYIKFTAVAQFTSPSQKKYVVISSLNDAHPQ